MTELATTPSGRRLGTTTTPFDHMHSPRPHKKRTLTCILLSSIAFASHNLRAGREGDVAFASHNFRGGREEDAWAAPTGGGSPTVLDVDGSDFLDVYLNEDWARELQQRSYLGLEEVQQRSYFLVSPHDDLRIRRKEHYEDLAVAMLLV